ncbi:MAG: hypothetical protein JWN39_62 [Ilumatobacteraceae bacterium]|nr:hypothetical protein [Ilumatobacteraceae bacterium]
MHASPIDTRWMHSAERRATLLSIVSLGVVLTFAASACGASGGGASAAPQVASLGSATAGSDTASSTPADTQDALLAYAKCMRDNGIDMADPTFDANGNPTGGVFGRNSGVDRQSEEFQTAQGACGNLLKGVTFGGGQGGRLDRDAIQTSLNDFTACLRDKGLDVDDITFGNGQGRANGGGGFGGPPGTGGATGGSVPAGATPGDGSTPPGGGFGGPPGTGGGNGGGAGFDPSARIIERLGLDATDPTVKTAIDACQSILDSAFQPQSSTTTTG